VYRARVLQSYDPWSRHCAAALAVSLKREWTRVAVRVAGSWIAAIGLLMAAWSLR